MAELDDTVKEFLIESLENLERLDSELLILEADPSNLDTVNTIFRTVHTIKGTCGFFDFKKLERVSHVGENLLDSLRDGSIEVTKETITALLSLCDVLKEVLSSIEASGEEGTGDYSDLVETLNALNNQSSESPIEECLEGDSSQDEGNSNLQCEERDFVAEPISPSLDVIHLSEEFAVRSTDAAKEKDPKKSELADSSLRVDVEILDKLMNLVGELVLARNQVLQFTKKQNDSEFTSTSQRLNLITSELQEGVMRTRMQPISTVWNKLPRIVRDISISCSKQIALEMQGKETELDKTIIEAIKDPLTHIIRNSVDHGIESVEKRVAAGKMPEGTLLLRAFHEGGQVIIEISDDGAGLNIEKIRRKALEKGLISGEQADQMDDGDIHRLIFLPGFSTAEKVTNISGRGVGMDVVRSNIEKIGGVVDVTSQFGRGSKFTIKIPLTLAIIPALIVTTRGNRYAIPQVNLLELVRVAAGQSKNAIERIQGRDFYRLRGKILPLVYLDEQLELVSEKEEDLSKNASTINLVVVRADNHQFGLVVDAIHDTEEIVVKPLGRLLKAIPTFAGATIMGDGQVALILDVVGLARKAEITKKESIVGSRERLVSDEGATIDQQQMFVFEIGKNKRAAVPLENVYRLEEFSAEQLEYAGNQLVTQYREGILPLVDLRSFFGEVETQDDHVSQAFVYCDNGKFAGFLVGSIVDIVQQRVAIESPYRMSGVLGSSIIQGKVTDILDLHTILDSLNLLSGTTNEGAVQ